MPRRAKSRRSFAHVGRQLLLLMLSSGASMLDVAPLHAQATTSVGAAMSGRGAPQVSAIAKSIEQEAATAADVAAQMPSLVSAVAAAAQAIRLRSAPTNAGVAPVA